MKIEIGKEFYRYVALGGIFTYSVIGIRSYEADSLYELECQNCTHGYKCLLLCALDDDNKHIEVLLNELGESLSDKK